MSKTVAETVCEMIAKEFAIDESEVTPNADLSVDLGLDSLDRTELAVTLEDHYEISIDDEDIDELNRVSEVIALVQQKLKK